jgi:hypothetical protein
MPPRCSRCLAPERWCPDISQCSVRGLCSALLARLEIAAAAKSPGAAAAEASKAAAFVPPVDKAPPKLRLLGNGTAALTPAGATLMMDNVTWNADWADPGATAVDAIDGDVSGRIQRLGVGECRGRPRDLLLCAARAGNCSCPCACLVRAAALHSHPHPTFPPLHPQPHHPAGVKTSMPTPPDKAFSYVIEYAVDDTSGNAAPTARRIIRVVCPGAEAYCVDPESGAGACTVGGVCGRPAALAAFAATAAMPASGAPGGAGGSGASAATAAAPRPAVTPPNITLVGAATIELPAGAKYDRCPPGAALGLLCERGAAAGDALDGPLDRVVKICGSPWRTAAGVRPVPVLLACGIDGAVPGEYALLFTATNSAGLTASATRRLLVRAACPPGESLCPDKISCSEGGTCVARGAASAAAAAAPADAAAAPARDALAARAAKADEAKAAPNQPPRVALRTSNALGPMVYIRRAFGTYAACGPKQLPTTDVPCELGASALDPDGGPKGKGEVDLTGELVVCPPAACLTVGCSPEELKRHRFAVKVGPRLGWGRQGVASRGQARELKRHFEAGSSHDPTHGPPQPHATRSLLQGLAGCPIDVMAAEGTRFDVTFWAWDTASPPLNASVTRGVTLSKACPAAAAPYLCADLGGSYFCSGGRQRGRACRLGSWQRHSKAVPARTERTTNAPPQPQPYSRSQPPLQARPATRPPRCCRCPPASRSWPCCPAT